MRLFRSISAVIILIMILLGCATTKTKKYTLINEDDVLEIMSEVEGAALDKNIDALIKHMAPSIIIEVTIDTTSGQQTVQMSREQYKNETLNGWAMMSHYEYRRENDEITISDDKQNAVVETDVIESYVYQGQSVNARTHEIITIEIIDGKLLVTEINAFMKYLIP